MTRTIRGLAVTAMLLVLGLVTAGSAPAASRSFDIENHTRWDFELASVNQVRCDYWRKWSLSCDLFKWYEIEFEGRPAHDSVLEPDEKHDFELKYAFSRRLEGRPNYAAEMIYYGPGSTVVIHINTSNWGRHSECDVQRQSDDAPIRCTTDGGGTIKLRPDNGDDK